MISGEAETWINAHTRATGTTAGGTGLPSLAGSTVKGHLLEVATRAENSFAVSVMNKMLTFNYSIAVNGPTTNTWLGLTDTDDAPISALEAGTSRTTNWIWAGTSGGAGANGAIRIEDTMEAPTTNLLTFWADATTNEPNDSGGTNWPFGEDAGELRGDGKWNDLPHKIGPANNSASTIIRRFLIEWPLDQLLPVPEAEILPQYYTAQTGAGGTWNLYYLDHVMQTWQAYADRYNDANFRPASFTGLASMVGNTTPGHLIELSDQYEHSFAYRLAVFVAAWTGLTDNESYGGQESNNASNNPTNKVQPFWVWNGTASTNTYRRWNGGNPDDAGANEDAGEMLTPGFINDNQMNNINGVIRRGLVEWDIQSPLPIIGAVQFDPLMAGTRPLSNTPAVGTWAIKHIFDPVHL